MGTALKFGGTMRPRYSYLPRREAERSPLAVRPSSSDRFYRITRWEQSTGWNVIPTCVLLVYPNTALTNCIEDEDELEDDYDFETRRRSEQK